MNANAATEHLRASAEAERARYRELCSVLAERIRQYVETQDGRLPPAIVEITGAELLRQLIAASDRLEATERAIDYADGPPYPSVFADHEIPF